MLPVLNRGLQCSYHARSRVASRSFVLQNLPPSGHQQRHCRRRSSMATPAAAGEALPAASAAPADGGQQQDENDPIVQWVVLRRDLWGELGWPLGPVIAQACHASTAAMFLHLEDEQTRAYVSPGAIDHMHTVGHGQAHPRLACRRACPRGPCSGACAGSSPGQGTPFQQYAASEQSIVSINVSICTRAHAPPRAAAGRWCWRSRARRSCAP